MSEYKGIKGFQVQTREDDPSPTEAQAGDFYYNSSTGQFKVITDGGAPIGTWASGGNTNTARLGINGGAGTQTAGLSAGGSSGDPASDTKLATAEQFNGSTWTEVGDLNTGRRELAGVGTSSSNAMAISGQASTDNVTNVESWDGSSWTEIADVNSGRSEDPGAGGSNSSAVFFGGNDSGGTNVIDYVTIQSAGNATDFGDSTSNQSNASGTSDSIRGVFSAGYYGSPHLSNVIEKVIIQSTGNSVDYGDLIDERIQGGSTSDSHGGLS